MTRRRLVAVLAAALVGLAIATVLGAAVALALFDVAIDIARWRDAIAARATASLGRPVILDGALELVLGRETRLRVGSVRILNPPGFAAAEFAALGDARARVDLFAALRGELHVLSIEAADGRVRLERTADGRANWAVTRARLRTARRVDPSSTRDRGRARRAQQALGGVRGRALGHAPRPRSRRADRPRPMERAADAPAPRARRRDVPLLGRGRGRFGAPAPGGGRTVAVHARLRVPRHAVARERNRGRGQTRSAVRFRGGHRGPRAGRALPADEAAEVRHCGAHRQGLRERRGGRAQGSARRPRRLGARRRARAHPGRCAAAHDRRTDDRHAGSAAIPRRRSAEAGRAARLRRAGAAQPAAARPRADRRRPRPARSALARSPGRRARRTARAARRRPRRARADRRDVRRGAADRPPRPRHGGRHADVRARAGRAGFCPRRPRARADRRDRHRRHARALRPAARRPRRDPRRRGARPRACPRRGGLAVELRQLRGRALGRVHAGRPRRRRPPRRAPARHGARHAARRARDALDPRRQTARHAARAR